MERRRAILSVADKSGLVELASDLIELGYQIVSSGGTARTLKDAGLEVITASAVTDFPEILGGRVKTLHPRIHGGILARDSDEDERELSKHGLTAVGIVVVNFYPFEKKVAEGAGVPDIIENIDIGGPSMLRAATKNFRYVLPVTDPADYALVVSKLRAGNGVDLETRLHLARKAFRTSARYESAIAAYFTSLSVVDEELSAGSGSQETETGGAFPRDLTMRFEKIQDLRYGENPHQRAAFYRSADEPPLAVAGANKLHGKELSYNNILDLDAAWRLVRELPEHRPAAAVIKHTNPCGAACGDRLQEAYVLARATDPTSAFGGIVALNRPVDPATAAELASTFLEAVIAPRFEPDALAILEKKKNLRLLTVDDPAPPEWQGAHFYRVVGGLLVQDWDREGVGADLEVASERKPTSEEENALRFAWKVAKHVKSNAIVLAKRDALIGVGAGQMSRVDSCRIAIEKAESPLDGAVAASDAFFPFRDGVDTLAGAGVTAVIQPGGSVRDEEVIAAANEHGMAMVFTGRRHFRH
jgi:phosphoribosylaminoimidazolecarboxamide formyltransferase/IMP cyclohydrolase